MFKLIPVLTHLAGNCLTMANWQEVGIKIVCYHLDALLIKPGISILQMLPNLRSFVGWPGEIVLNVNLPVLDKDKHVYTLYSSYDGSSIAIKENELMVLISQLQPDYLVFAEEWFTSDSPMIQVLAEKIKIFRNIRYQEGPFDQFVAQLNRFDVMESAYVSGHFELSQRTRLIKLPISFLESDSPAQAGMEGKVYSAEKTIDILNHAMSDQHILLDAACQCPICAQGLTRAYLHHLLLNTPLLAQRFLIQHNIYYYQWKTEHA